MCQGGLSDCDGYSRAGQSSQSLQYAGGRVQRGREGRLRAAGAGSPGVLATPQGSSQNSRLLGQVGLEKEGRNAAHFMVS